MGKDYMGRGLYEEQTTQRRGIQKGDIYRKGTYTEGGSHIERGHIRREEERYNIHGERTYMEKGHIQRKNIYKEERHTENGETQRISYIKELHREKTI